MFWFQDLVVVVVVGPLSKKPVVKTIVSFQVVLRNIISYVYE